MKTFAKTLLAAGAGVVGICGAANAATPYGSFTSTQGIAVGGCYQPVGDTYGGCFGPGYRPSTSYDDYAYRPLPARSVYDTRQDFHTLPYPASRGSDCTWDTAAPNHRRYDDFNVGSSSQWSKPLPTRFDRDYGRYDSRRFEDRYDGSPSFEPWRPMNVSNTNYRW